MANNINAAVTNEAQAQPVAEGTTKKFALKIVRVQLFENEDIVNVQLSFDKAIPGFVRDDEGNYVAADVDHVSISRSGLTRSLCESEEMLAMMRDGQNEPFTRAQISTILHGATLHVTRTFHRTGYTREDGSAIDRDQWFTEITNVSLTDFAKKLIQQLVMQRMMSE